MDSILEELFHGNIAPDTQYFSKQSEFGKAMKNLTGIEDELLSAFNDTEKETLKRYIDAQLEVNSLTAKSKFVYGFKLGAQIMLEAMGRVDMMNREIMENKTLQNLIASLGTDGEPEQPLGKYGRMAMKHLHDTDPQRFCLLKMTGELMKTMYRVDEDASEQVEAITQKLLRRNPTPPTEDILERTRHFNTQRCVAEELVIHEMVLAAEMTE